MNEYPAPAGCHKEEAVLDIAKLALEDYGSLCVL